MRSQAAGKRGLMDDIRRIINAIQGLPRMMLNQGAADTAILEFKSSDVAHGITTFLDTDTYAAIQKAGADDGGILIRGATEVTEAIVLSPFATTDNTTKSTAGDAHATVAAYTKDGTGLAAPGADANLFSITSAGNARFLFDQEGEMHSDAIIGVGDDWDDEDDLQLAADLSRLPKAKWDQVVRYNAKDFEQAGLITLSTDEDGTEHAFYKHRAMLDFHNCTFAAVLERMQAQDVRIAQLERALLKSGVDAALTDVV